jgi:hypothetical protein
MATLCAKYMNRNYAIIHITTAIVGILFGLFVAYVGYANYIEGKPELMPGRLILSAVLIAYSLLQIRVLIKNNISMVQLLAFPVIYILFGMYWEYIFRGYIKNWAPAVQAEASQQNIVSMLVLCIIIFVALYITFKRSANV